MPANEVTSEAVHALLNRWLPDRTITATRAQSGGSTPVYRVEAGREVFFLRLAEQAGERRDAEVRTHRLLTDAGVPVPSIVRFESEPGELDRSAALTTSMPGAPLLDWSGLDLDAASRRRVAYAAGRDLARINRIRVHGFGWVETVAQTDRSLVAEYPARSGWTSAYALAAREVVANRLLEDRTIESLRTAIERWIGKPDRTLGFLAHGDFDATHIFISASPYTYTGIIDLGEIRGADQLYDLGHALLQDGQSDREPIFESLYAGYREVTSLPAGVLADIRDQAIAIGTRQLAIFWQRSSSHSGWLASRLDALLSEVG